MKVVINREIVMDPTEIKKLLDKRAYEDWMVAEYGNTEPGRRQNKIRFTEQEKSAVRNLVKQLPRLELTVVYLRFWENLLIEEIGNALGLTFTQTDQVLERAIKRLRLLWYTNHKNISGENKSNFMRNALALA